MARIDQLRGIDGNVGRPAHHLQEKSEAQGRRSAQVANDFLYEIAQMQDQRKYSFAGDTLEGIYTAVEHSGYVTEGQRRAINNIRKGCGDEEI